MSKEDQGGNFDKDGVPADLETALMFWRRTQGRLDYAQEEIRLLREKVDLLLRRLYGAKSEKLSAEQQALLFEELGKSAEDPAAPGESAPEENELPVELAPVVAPKKRNGGKSRKPKLSLDELPVGETIVIDPEEVQAAPEHWEYSGEEVDEKLDFQPPRYQKLRIIRRRFRRRSPVLKEEIIAPRPAAAIEGGMVTERMLAHIIVSKFVDHLPLYRQQSQAARLHAVLSRQTTSRWLGQCAHLLQGLTRCVLEELRLQEYVQSDETMIRYLDPGGGRSRQGYMWVLLAPRRAIYFHWEASRAGQVLLDLLRGSQVKVLQCDGYAGYDWAGRQLPGMELAGCWAHVRRKFFEIREHHQLARWFIERCAILYKVESGLREIEAQPAMRLEVRQRQSCPVVSEIHCKLQAEQDKLLPSSALGKAAGYALNQWDSLELYLRDGRLEIDNNLVENAIRPTAVGKKNYLFFGAESGGKSAATFYTLTANCQLLGIDPQQYFTDVLTRLPSMTNRRQHELTPRNWLAERQGSQLPGAPPLVPG